MRLRTDPCGCVCRLVYIIPGVVFAAWAAVDLACLARHRLRPAYAVSVAGFWALCWLIATGPAIFRTFIDFSNYYSDEGPSDDGPSATPLDIWCWVVLPLLDAVASTIMTSVSPSLPRGSAICESEGAEGADECL